MLHELKMSQFDKIDNSYKFNTYNIFVISSSSQWTSLLVRVKANFENLLVLFCCYSKTNITKDLEISSIIYLRMLNSLEN